MSSCYTFQKLTMITLATIAISLIVGLVLMQYAHGQTLEDLQNGLRFPELEALLNYCYEHADRPNPLEDLIDKGFLSANFTGETCISIKQLEQKYRILLIEEMTNSKCYEVWDPSVSISQLEALFMGCDRRGLIDLD